MSSKVSVVIPVYNVETYLEKCVDSVLRQTYSDFEIILVDDGSTDASGRICDSFTDEKIKVIHQTNGGLSDARNTGTKAAVGEYITWLDSDDTLHPDFLKILVQLAEDCRADMAVGEFSFCKEGEECKPSEGNYATDVCAGTEAMKRMLEGRLHGTSACGMLIKRDLAGRYFFPYGKYHEDDLTTYQFYRSADRVAYTEQPLYFYLQRAGSIMHNAFGESDIAELDAADVIYNACEAMGEEYRKAALIKKTCNYCQVLFKCSDLKQIHYETYKRANDFIDSYWSEIFASPYIGKKAKIKIILYKSGLLKYVNKMMGKENA